MLNLSTSSTEFMWTIQTEEDSKVLVEFTNLNSGFPVDAPAVLLAGDGIDSLDFSSVFFFTRPRSETTGRRQLPDILSIGNAMWISVFHPAGPVDLLTTPFLKATSVPSSGNILT